MKIPCSTCIQPFWTKVCLQVGEGGGKSEIIATEMRHTDFTTLEEEQKPLNLGKEQLRPQEVQESCINNLFSSELCV